MAAFETIKESLYCLIQPWLFLMMCAAHIPQTIKDIVTSGNVRKLLSPSDFSDELFGHAWVTIGPMAKEGALDVVTALLEGRVSGGQAHSDVISVPVHGTVLEVGAGSGMWADVFARIHTGAAAATNGEKEGGMNLRSRKSGKEGGIQKIYGVEPNPISAKALREQVKHVGLDGVYEVVPVGIEDVTNPDAWGGKIEPESVDCVVTVRCMCSIPDPEENAAALYSLLKPGGHWYVFEHIKTDRGAPLVPLYQRFVNSIWMWFMGSCRICRSTDQTLRNLGEWKKFDLAVSPDEPACSVLPHVIGVLTKK